MASEQLSEFEKGQNVVYNYCGLLLHNIAKKLNCHHSWINIFLKNYKTGNYQWKGHWHKRKTAVSEDAKIFRKL